ncbi:MAG: hypothetical protein K2Y23_06745 [Cyanobacteria bacterium]|nr:hypothetical protein [Cyanobacteriota bacterium]
MTQTACTAAGPRDSFVPRCSIEGQHLRHYAAEMVKGSLDVIDIQIRPFLAGDRALGVLCRHRAHFINACRQWTIESLAA